MEKTEDQKLMENMRILQTQALKALPFKIRIRAVVMIFNKGNVADKDVNWERINDILFSDSDIHHYNIKKEVKSFLEVEEVLSQVIMIESGLDFPWTKEVCKDCRQEFYIKHGEVEFFLKKGLHLPKRCPKCREKRKIITN